MEEKKSTKKYIVALSCFATSIFLLSCHENNSVNQNSGLSKDIISDSLVYDVINYLFNHDELNSDVRSNLISNKDGMPFIFYFKEDSLKLLGLDTFFTDDDIKFIFSQKEQFNKFSINQDRTKNKTIISSDSLRHLNHESFSTISFPLFNITKDIFIIRTTYNCGVLCGHSGTYIYKKKNSRWVLMKIFQESVS